MKTKICANPDCKKEFYPIQPDHTLCMSCWKALNLPRCAGCGNPYRPKRKGDTHCGKCISFSKSGKKQ